MASPSVIGLIPARQGSKRLPGKNVRPFAGHPLIAYSIGAALDSGVFDRVVVSTDSPDVARLAQSYGAEVPFLRPPEMAADQSPDIEWVRYTLGRLVREGERFDAFSILRPTSPFRLPATIRRAWKQFRETAGAESLRAVERCRQHPAKMWVLDGAFMRPLQDDGGARPPWHSSAYQALPPVYAQNASLEIAWSRIPLEEGTIAGQRVVPFLTENFEGHDINKPEDWLLAEALIQHGLAVLPAVRPPVGQPAA
ncbi:MAG TPA: acylneuraminate cytidylyltransferase family protein [Opitutaceae bacterium]|nr:acylneuraminate cytidylyltransferase family protein [Opitutaceae bacterium]